MLIVILVTVPCLVGADLISAPMHMGGLRSRARRLVQRSILSIRGEDSQPENAIPRAESMCAQGTIWIGRTCAGADMRGLHDVCLQFDRDTQEFRWYVAKGQCIENRLCLPILKNHIEHATCDVDRLAITTAQNVLPDILYETNHGPQQMGHRMIATSAIGAPLGLATFSIEVDILKHLPQASISAVLTGETHDSTTFTLRHRCRMADRLTDISATSAPEPMQPVIGSAGVDLTELYCGPSKEKQPYNLPFANQLPAFTERSIFATSHMCHPQQCVFLEPGGKVVFKGGLAIGRPAKLFYLIDGDMAQKIEL